MALSVLSHSIGTLLTVALLGSAGSPTHILQAGQSGYPVAEVQAELGVLGYDVGPVTGRVNASLIRGAADYATDFGLSPHGALNTQLSDTLQMVGTVPISSGGALILAVEDDLQKMDLYHGALGQRVTPALHSALASFQQEVGLPETEALSAATLSELAHYTAVRVTAQHRWSYTAQPGDTLKLLAWASNLPERGFSRANDAHGNVLWIGQSVHWHTKSAPPKPAPKPPVVPRQSDHQPSGGSRIQRSAPAPRPNSPTGYDSAPVGPTSSTPTIENGVLSNLKPLSDLVVMNPRVKTAEELLDAEQLSNATVDVAITGQWALLHQELVKELVGQGNEIVLSGYSTFNLNALPGSAVAQELTWGKEVLTRIAGTTPTFVMTPGQPSSATVSTAAEGLNMVAMNANVRVDSRFSAASTLSGLLLAHTNQVVLMTGTTRFLSLFHELSVHHFVFETLGQIWANQ